LPTLNATVPFEAIGRRAIEVITKAINGEKLHISPLVTPKLVVRRSAAPPTKTSA
jgi:DNA-binding LacI/PurR family transcriptional regulator